MILRLVLLHYRVVKLRLLIIDHAHIVILREGVLYLWLIVKVILVALYIDWRGGNYH